MGRLEHLLVNLKEAIRIVHLVGLAVSAIVVLGAASAWATTIILVVVFKLEFDFAVM